MNDLMESIASEFDVEIEFIIPGDKSCQFNGEGTHTNASSYAYYGQITIGIYQNDELKLLSFFHELGHHVSKNCDRRMYMTKYDIEQLAWEEGYKLAHKYEITFTENAKRWADEQLNTYLHYRKID